MMAPMPPLLPLIVVATAPEAPEALEAPATQSLLQAPGALRARVVISGVGAVSAALSTAQALAQAPASLVISAGIGGAYPGSGLRPGDLAVSSEMVLADLGAWDGDTFLDLAALGLSTEPDAAHYARFPAWEGARAFAGRVGAAYGPLLTLSSVTGSQAGAQALVARFPGALTEGMEGAGVAQAAHRAGVPALELRAVSNPVGPRDRAAWQIAQALAALRRGLSEGLGLLEEKA